MLVNLQQIGLNKQTGGWEFYYLEENLKKPKILYISYTIREKSRNNQTCPFCP